MFENVRELGAAAWERTQEVLLRRRLAYRSAFFKPGKPGELSVAGEVMLQDLARFCRAYESTAHFSPITGALDPLASSKADGRREVWLYITRHLKIERAAFAGFEESA